MSAGPTNIPAVTANELRLDNLFELQDHSVAIVDYESTYKKEDKLKYLNYLTGIANRYRNEKKECPPLRMIVIYTGDVRRNQVSAVYELGALKMSIETAFLCELDADRIFCSLQQKVRSGWLLSDEELMEFIILPLSFRRKEEKIQKAREMAKMAEMIADQEQQLFVMAGLLTFTDKIIDITTANKMKEKINMTKVEWLIRQDVRRECEMEMQQALKEALDQAQKQFEKEKEQERRKTAKQYEKEKQQHEKEKQHYEEKIQYLIKWMTEKGYEADKEIADILK